jgi:hypothetical protein
MAAPHPADHIPELAGIATYASASHVGYSVDENVRRLLRLHWVERRMFSILVARLTGTPEWEVKCGFALHQWQSAEHAELLRRRVAEMRTPVPLLDSSPDTALDAFLDEVGGAHDTVEILAGAYGVAYAELATAYRRHIAASNPLADHPTRRILRFALSETEEAVEWGAGALRALTDADADARERAATWQAHLRACVGALAEGGVGSDGGALGAIREPASAPASQSPPSFRPQRDARFSGQYNFEFPPHAVYKMPGVPAEERNLALLCKRTLEMDVPEMMASFMSERTDQPWEFYRDYSRQLWDEARHAMMGTVALVARGVDWKKIPLNISFSLRLNLHAKPVERQMMLYAIEHSLMPAATGKRFEYETAVAAGDALSAHFQDYDWADEVLHAQIGRRLLQREGIGSEEARERAHDVHERTWAALEQYRVLDAQRNWWPEFVRAVLGKESAVGEAAADQINIFSE